MKLLGGNFARATLLACTALLLFASVAYAADYHQGFDSLGSSGWSVVKRSTADGGPGWSQGKLASFNTFSSKSGPANSYAGVDDMADGIDYFSPWDARGLLSDWLISPKLTSISNGDVVRFSQRVQYVGFAVTNNLEVRVATGDSCEPGAGPEDSGDFARQLFDITVVHWVGSRSRYVSSTPWRDYELRVSGLPPGDHAGCFAIHNKSVPNAAGYTYTGIDSFEFDDEAGGPNEIGFLGLVKSYGTGRSGVIRGSADAESIVKIFTNEDCSGDPSVSTGSAEFNWPGATFLAHEDGPTRLSATSTTPDGQVSRCFTFEGEYRHEEVPPVTTIELPRWIDGPTPVRLKATDEGSGVAEIYYRTLRTLPRGEFTWSEVYDPDNPPVVEALADVWIDFWSVDRAGNVEAVRRVDIKAPPPVPPLELIVDVAHAGSVSTATVAWNEPLAWDGKAVAESYICSIDTNAPAPCASPWKTGPIAAGNHYVTVRGVNTNGAVVVGSTRLWVPPVVRAAAEPDGNSSVPAGEFRPRFSALRLIRARIPVVLRCRARIGAKPCTGTVALELKDSSGRERRLTAVAPLSQATGGEQSVARLKLTRRGNALLADAGPRPWVTVRIVSGDSATTFRRKLLH